jgi:hypothetical protein
MRNNIFLSRGIIEAVVILVLLVGIGIALLFYLHHKNLKHHHAQIFHTEDKPASATPSSKEQYDEVLPEVIYHLQKNRQKNNLLRLLYT